MLFEVWKNLSNVIYIFFFLLGFMPWEIKFTAQLCSYVPTVTQETQQMHMGHENTSDKNTKWTSRIMVRLWIVYLWWQSWVVAVCWILIRPEGLRKTSGCNGTNVCERKKTHDISAVCGFLYNALNIFIIRKGADKSLAFPVSSTGGLQHNQNNVSWMG
jgi:hypothetical protein